MNTKLTLGLLVGMLALGLTGCAGHHTRDGSVLTAEQSQNWKNAALQFNACNKVWWDQEVADAPQLKLLVSGHSDPQYLQKLTSKDLVTKTLKDSLIKYRPQQIACRKALFDTLGDDNPAVKLMYQKNFNTQDDAIVKVLDGKLKTMGEVNQAYISFNNEVIERRTRLKANIVSN